MDFHITTTLRTFGLTGFSTRQEARKAAYAVLVDGEHLETCAQIVATADEARKAFFDLMADEEYADNHREAFQHDAEAYAAYQRQADDGCCGSADIAYKIGGMDGNTLWIGCNYGH